MNWRFMLIACTLLAAVGVPSALGSEGIIIWSVSEPSLNPNPVESGGMGEVSFEVEVWNRDEFRGCRESVVTGMYGFPVCAYLLQWTISLDGEWLADGSTPLGTGSAPYVRTLQEERTSTFINVNERVYVDAPAGEHTLHVQVNWVAGVPISDARGLRPVERAYPCGLDDRVDVPVVQCTYRGTGWKSASPVEVQVVHPPEPGLHRT